MKRRDSTLAIMREPFAAGLDENLSPIMHHLWKLEGGAIYFCHNGWAHAVSYTHLTLPTKLEV